MPPPRKRPRACTAPPSPDQNETTPPPQPPPPPEEEDGDPPALTTTLPADLLPEIAARSDITTLVRFAACCKPLRRDILRPAFIRRVCREPGPGGGAAVVPPFVLGFLHAYDRASMKEEYPGDPRRGVLLRGAPRPVRGSHSRCLPSRRLRAPDLVPQRPRRAPPQGLAAAAGAEIQPPPPELQPPLAVLQLPPPQPLTAAAGAADGLQTLHTSVPLPGTSGAQHVRQHPPPDPAAAAGVAAGVRSGSVGPGVDPLLPALQQPPPLTPKLVGAYHAELNALATAAGLARLASTTGPRGYAGSLPLDGGMRVFDHAVSAGRPPLRDTGKQVSDGAVSAEAALAAALSAAKVEAAAAEARVRAASATWARERATADALACRVAEAECYLHPASSLQPVVPYTDFGASSSRPPPLEGSRGHLPDPVVTQLHFQAIGVQHIRELVSIVLDSSSTSYNRWLVGGIQQNIPL
nr:unnamed protein product [Digitaria exilis]